LAYNKREYLEDGYRGWCFQNISFYCKSVWDCHHHLGSNLRAHHNRRRRPFEFVFELYLVLSDTR